MNDPTNKPITEVIPSRVNETSALASANAPIVFFDAAPAFAFYNGVGAVTLEANRLLHRQGKVASDRVIVAHLRMNLEAAVNLRSALDGIILAAAPKAPSGAH